MNQQNNWQKESLICELEKELEFIDQYSLANYVADRILQTHNEAIKAGIEGLPEEKPLQSNLAPTYSPFEQTFNQGQNAYRWQAIENLKKLLKEDE